MNLIEKLKPELEKLVAQNQNNLKTVKKIALGEAWKLLQLATASVVQTIENIAADLSGPDKKAAAMSVLSQFYDSVFVVIDIPFVPTILEPIIHKHVKNLIMILVGSTIDAMVTTFKNIGLFRSNK
jgi:ABC-type lipopolysaccharide export system ATPase subunit